MRNDTSIIVSYRVTVGHSAVVVQAASPEEAITFARRQLAQELPRFYDLITAMSNERFTVLQAA